MTRLFGTLVVLALLVLGAPPAISASAPDVSLRLLGMAPWVTPDSTDLGLQAVATNTGPGTAGDLSFGVTVFTPSRTRNQYEDSLREDPAGAGVLFARFPLVRTTIPRGGQLKLRLTPRVAQEVGEAIL